MDNCDEAIAQFEDYLRGLGLARSTVAGYVMDVRSFLKWFAGHGVEASPATFTSQQVEAYKVYLQDELGRSPASVNRFLQSMRKFGRFAKAAGIRDTNPAQGPRLLAHEPQPTPRILTDLQADQLDHTCRTRASRTLARDLAIISLLLHSGVRVSELVALRVKDVELDRQPPQLMVLSQGKRAQRQLPLDLRAQGALRAYLEQRQRSAGTDLFPGRNGRPLSTRSVQQVIAQVGREAGLEISARILRDTYAARLWEQTRDLALLTERMGFLRPTTALRYVAPQLMEAL